MICRLFNTPHFPYTTLFRSRQRRKRDPTATIARTRKIGNRVSPLIGAIDEFAVLICPGPLACRSGGGEGSSRAGETADKDDRSEEHTSELQSRLHLVCRLLP